MTRPLEQKVALVRNPDKSYALAAVVKRTYTFTSAAKASVSLADEPAALREIPDVDLEGFSELRDEGDLGPQKLATDVVVLGHAHAPEGAKETFVAIAVGKMARRLSVIGRRHAEVRPDGKVVFTPPDSFTKVPLSPRLAYGGYDAYAQARLEPVPGPLAASSSEPVTGLFAYPRNNLGRAFFIDLDRTRADGALLPQIEDPTDPLLPDRFFVPSVDRWIDAPIAASLGWVHWGSYPRLYRLVGTLLHHAEPSHPIRESLFPDGRDLLEHWEPTAASVPARSLQGASPGLACERLRGDELVILENLHPSAPRIEFNLPGEIPVVTLRAPDVKAFSPAPVLQTVRIEPDLSRFSMTYCATVPLLAPAMRDFIERVELAVTWRKL